MWETLKLVTNPVVIKSLCFLRHLPKFSKEHFLIGVFSLISQLLQTFLRNYWGLWTKMTYMCIKLSNTYMIKNNLKIRRLIIPSFVEHYLNKPKPDYQISSRYHFFQWNMSIYNQKLKDLLKEFNNFLFRSCC